MHIKSVFIGNVTKILQLIEKNALVGMGSHFAHAKPYLFSFGFIIGELVATIDRTPLSRMLLLLLLLVENFT